MSRPISIDYEPAQRAGGVRALLRGAFMTKPHSRINWELIISGIALAGSVMYFGISNEHRHTMTESNLAMVQRERAERMKAEEQADQRRDEELGLLRTAVIDLLEDKKKREGPRRRKPQNGILEQMKQRQSVGPQGKRKSEITNSDSAHTPKPVNN